ncbi:MFS transporter [Desulfofundulus thermosubterraneus]|uniref:Sugar phosphate permease n=1 Tax=Desulfofundulus thermosubterraneus DSM 16057 TaxID=1121432 RepID=A0A1M6DZG6_9FIRM|nr:MFS transporter [Desulfofundulus thermosubterraneus]SHI78533.1 Sugar phosphate permease [Desulfofundulus thermosubterraneus DSM 16057]
MRETRQREHIPLVQLALIQLLVLLPAYCLPAVLPLVEKQWGISHGEAGIMVAAFQAGYIAAALVALPLTDRIDARYVMAGGAILSTFTHTLFPLLARDALSGTLLRTLAGAGLGGIYMPGIKVISLTPRSRGRAVGFYVSSYLVGTSLSFALTGALTAFFTWQEAYLALAGVSFAAIALSFWLWRQPGTAFLPGTRKAKIPANSSGRDETPGLASQTGPPEPAQGIQQVETSQRNLAMVLVILAYAAHMWEMYGLRSWLTPFLTVVFQDRYAQATSLAATLTALSVMLGAPSTLAAGWLSDRLGRTGTAMAIMLTSAACSFSMGWLLPAPPWLLLPVGLVYSLTVTADSPIFSTGLAEIAPREKLGRIMAWQTFVGYIAATVSPAVFGLILDVYSGPAGWILAFSSLGAGVLGGAALMFYLSFLPASRAMGERPR